MTGTRVAEPPGGVSRSGPPTADPGRSPVLGWLAAAAVALLLLRLVLAAQPALWIDEAFSLYHARLPLAHLWTEGWRLESSPPLYYSTLWAWIRLVGDGETAARMLSVLLTGVGALFVFRAARVLADREAGAIAALVWLLPTLGLEYSVEIRPYALQQCWIAIALAAFARVLVGRRDRGASLDRGRVVRALATIVMAGAAAFYTHSTSFAFLAALALAAAGYGWAVRAGRGYARAWMLSCVALAVLCVPQAVTMIGVLSTNRAGLAWMPSALEPVTLVRVARQVVLGQVNWGFWSSTPLACAVYAAFALAAWRVRRRPEVLAVTVGVAACGALIMVSADALQTILMHRTALWMWVPLAILVGCAARTVDWTPLRVRVGAVAFVALFAVTHAGYLLERPGQRPWHDTLAELTPLIRPGDRVLVFDPEVACMLDHYATGPLRAAPRGRYDRGEARLFRTGQRLDLGCNRVEAIDPATFGAPSGGGSDWVLTGDDHQRGDLDALLRAAPTALRAGERIERARRVHATRVTRP